MTLHHIKHKPIGTMLLHWSKSWGRVPAWTTDGDEDEEDFDTSGIISPISPFLPRVSTGRCNSQWIPTILMTIRLRVNVRPLCQGGTSRLWHKLFLNIKPEPSLWLCSGTPHTDQGLGQSKEGLMVSLYQGPVNKSIQSSLTRRYRILNTVKKGKVSIPDFTTQPGGRMKVIG